ncbi:glycosyltransferase [Candidatus Microgenomates bacterium]|nr:glycosyltransferase [Candidatus Microgenomates bacterium]
MKIVFLNKHQESETRGVETFLVELASRLSSNNDIEIISKINYFKLLTKPFNLIVPTNGRGQVVLIRLISWLRGKKMLISGHSGIGLDDRLNLYAFPNTFVALSTKAKDWAKKTNPFVQVEKIPNGIDIKKFSKKGQKIEIGLPGPIILSVAALTEQKRLELAIGAVSKLKKGSLLIVGSGSEEEKLKSLAEKLIPGRFKIMAFPYKDMPKVYRSVDLFTYPSVPWESFGIVLLEAMASGLGVVVTNDPIRTEIVGNAGIMVDPTNTNEYTSALQTALDTNWGNKPRKQATKFDWNIIACKYEQLFKKLLK